MENKIELKSCPFCGNKVDIREISNGRGRFRFYVGYQIECDNCGIQFKDESTIIVEDGVPKIENDGYTKLIRRWNTRVYKEK